MEFIIIAVVLIYIVYKSFSNKLCLLVIPFFLTFGPSAFFDRAPFSHIFNLFREPANLCLVTIFFLWLILKEGRPRLYERPRGVHVTLIVIFLAFLFINVCKTITEYPINKWLICDVFPQLYYFTYFIFEDIFARFSKKNIIGMMRAVVIINSLLMILFILSSLNVYNFYEDLYWIKDAIAPAIFPAYSDLAVCLMVSTGALRYENLIIMIITLVGMLIINVRSWLAASFFVIVIGFFLYARKRKKAAVILAILYFTLIIGTSWLLFARIFPNRFVALTRKSETIETVSDFKYESSFIVRRYAIFDALKRSAERNLIFGYGLVGQSTIYNVYGGYTGTDLNYFRYPDAAWVSAFIRYGIVGTILLASVLFYHFYAGLKRIFANGTTRFDPLLVTAELLLIWQIALTFFSWMFVSNPAMALWYFPLITRGEEYSND